MSDELMTFKPEPQTFPITVLLVDDQLIIVEAVKRMLADEKDIHLFYCQDPSQAVKMAMDIKPTLILQDLVMPEVDGLSLVRYFRVNPITKNVPLIVLSSKEEPTIKAEAFALGANDYMVKLPDKVELIARIRYHSASYIRLLERNQAYEKLAESQRVLNAELAEAAAYVRSLLPDPLESKIKTEWLFIPSTKLGGDAFGYHWIDEEHFVIYLLDVCGHGVGAAVLSISVMNVLRSQSLPDTDFTQPHEVLKALNEAFLMEKHNNMFFTIWYGVFHRSSRKLVYSSGGHPPAILFHNGNLEELKTGGLVIGGMEGTQFESLSTVLKPDSRLYIFSDGVYEITEKDSDNHVMTLAEFVQVLKAQPNLKKVLEHQQLLNGPGPFSDDFSILEAIF